MRYLISFLELIKHLLARFSDMACKSYIPLAKRKKRKKKGSTFLADKKKDGTRKYTVISESEYRSIKASNAEIRSAQSICKMLKMCLKTIEPLVKKCKVFDEIVFEHIKDYPQKMLETDRGFRVEDRNAGYSDEERYRSKSEMIIAGALEKYGIPFTYEPAMFGDAVHPDFVIEDNIHGKTVIWEHFGMLDDNSYVFSALKKIALYKKHGFEINDNLILTYEFASQNPGAAILFGVKDAEDTVKRNLLPQD